MSSSFQKLPCRGRSTMGRIMLFQLNIMLLIKFSWNHSQQIDKLDVLWFFDQHVWSPSFLNHGKKKFRGLLQKVMDMGNFIRFDISSNGIVHEIEFHSFQCDFLHTMHSWAVKYWHTIVELKRTIYHISFRMFYLKLKVKILFHIKGAPLWIFLFKFKIKSNLCIFSSW